MGFLLIVWLLFLLHIVESTTNDYFVTSLQLAVAILKLSPNVSALHPPVVGKWSGGRLKRSEVPSPVGGGGRGLEGKVTHPEVRQGQMPLRVESRLYYAGRMKS